MRTLRWVVLVAAVAVAGCGSSSEADVSDDPAVDVPELLGAGSALGDGFVVPLGAAALTPPLPDGGSQAQLSAWSVSMLIEDPIAVFNDLAQQAVGLGFDLHLSGWPQVCRADDSPDAGVSNTTSWPLPPGQAVPRSVSCSIEGYRLDGEVLERLWLSTHRTFRSGLRDDVGAGGEVSVERLPADSRGLTYDQIPYDATPIAPLPVDYPSPEPWPTPPDLAVGDPLVEDESNPEPTWEPRLVAGSRPVLPGAASGFRGGFSAVLDVTGDPDEVLAGYVAQMADWSAEYGQPPTSEESTTLGRRTVHAVASIDGSSLHAVLVVGGDGEPTRLLFTYRPG